MSRLDDLDSLISNLDEEEKENLEKAKRAAEEKIRAEQAAETAKINKAKIEEAKAKYQEAQNIVGSLGIKYEGDANVPSKKTQNFLGKVSNLRFASGFLAGVVALSLLGGAYLLGRKSYTGTIRNSNSISQTADDYEELTDEKFYELCDSLKKDYQDRGIYFYEEDVEKFVLMSNINRIAVDNRELISDMITTYSIEGITNGANSLISTLVNYNNKVYDDTKSNSGFVLASDAIFDPKEKKTAQKIEGMVNEIGNSMSDNAKMNQLIYELLVGLKESTTDFSQLEDGTKFALCITLRPIREIYGKDDCRVVVTLDHVNAELIKYFVSEFGDENEYYVNGWWTGAYQQVYAILNQNQNCKTLTK